MAGNQYQTNYYSTLLLKTAIEAGITSPEELANIMGNAHVETWGFSTMHESFRYRSATAVVAAVSSADERFPWKQIENAVASRDPQQVATIMYENRRDLGNTEVGDGWKFHGRGFFQYTGRHNYTEYGRKFGVDLSGNPDMAAEPEMAAKLAVAYWQEKVPLDKRQNVSAAARIINGGDNGKTARIAASEGWAAFITPQLIEDIKNGVVTPEQFVAGPSTRQDLVERSVVTDRSGRRAARSELADGMLQLHESGPAVTKLQQQLARLGYTDAHGHPIKADGDFGARTKEAVQAFQREHGLDLDGVAGSKTLEALKRADRQLLTHPHHQHHDLYTQALEKVHAAEEQRSIKAGPHSERLAATLTVEAIREGMTRIDRVELNDRGTLVRAVQANPLRDEPGLNRTTDAISTQQAMQQSLQESSEQAQQVSVNRQLQQEELLRQQVQANVQAR